MLFAICTKTEFAIETSSQKTSCSTRKMIHPTSNLLTLVWQRELFQTRSWTNQTVLLIISLQRFWREVIQLNVTCGQWVLSCTLCFAVSLPSVARPTKTSSTTCSTALTAWRVRYGPPSQMMQKTWLANSSRDLQTWDSQLKKHSITLGSNKRETRKTNQFN